MSQTHAAPSLRMLCALLLGYALVLALFAFHARPVMDEGIYLFAGTRVAEGALPYRDFPTSQSPLLPYAYAATPVIADSALLGGRLISCLASWVGMAASLWLAGRLGGRWAAVVTLGAGLATLPYLWVQTTVRAQSIATPLLLLGIVALAWPRRGVGSWSVAPSLLLASTALRLTNGLAFAAVALWVAWQLRRSPARLAAVAGLLAAQAALFFAPLWLAPRHAWFHLFRAQLSRGERFGSPEQPWTALLHDQLVVYADLVSDAWILVALALAMTAGLVWRAIGGWRPQLDEPLADPATAQFTLVVLALLAFAPHLALSYAFPSYLVPLWAPLLPAVGIAAAGALSARVPGPWPARVFATLLFALAALNAAGQWKVWIGPGEGSTTAFRQIARQIAELGGPECTMLTFQADLALESGCRLFPGLEYAHFSYSAHAPTPEAGEPGFLNLEELRRRVAADPPELIAIGPIHPLMFAGETEHEVPWSEIKTPEARRRQALGFLGADAERYRFRLRTQIPTGAHRHGWRERIKVLVFQRVD